MHVGVSVSDCQFPGLTALSGTQRARARWSTPWIPAGSRCSPSLLGSLAGDAEPGADLGPGVAERAQTLDCPGYGGVDLLGQAEHEGQGLDVAVADATGVGAQDAPGECAVLVVLNLPPRAL